ncbi:MAG: flagellar filament capping protein FliD [Myxococcota bacterium]
MVSVGGLASGLDTNGIISQLVELERGPINSLQSDIAQLQQVQATFTGLSPSFSQLRSSASALSLANLDNPSISLTTSSANDENAVTATARSSATAGRHQLTVQQVATSARIGSQGFADSDTTPVAGASGNFAVQVGSSGAVVSVAVTTSTTMQDLANAINAASGEVTATIINDGTNANSSRMVLSSSVTGRGNDITILTNGTNLEFSNNTIEAASADDGNAGTYTGAATSSGTYTGTTNKTFIVEILAAGAAGAATYRVSEDGGLTWDDNGGAGYTTSTTAATIGANTEGVNLALSNSGTLAIGDRFYVDVSTPVIDTAQDAVFTLDGIVQTRSSNSVTDALEGVTLDLAGVTTGTVTINLSQDDETIVSAVEEFVESYNAVFTAIRDNQSFDTETFEAGILLGDRTANAILSQMRSALVREVTGTGSSYTSLAVLGITSSRTGGLTFDTGEFREALADDRDGVLAVLASTESGSTSFLDVQSRPDEETAGSFGVAVSTAPEKATLSAGGTQTDTIGATEVLSFTFSTNHTESSPTLSSFSVTLQAGDTLSQVVDRLNSAFATQGVGIRAFNSSNTLAIETTEYGQDQYFSVVSDTASGANTSRIGTTVLMDNGVDIVGSLNGEPTTGLGNLLQATDDSSLAGLVVTYTGATTGSVGSVNLTTGLGSTFSSLVDALNSGTESVVGARTASIQDQIDQIEERILDREEQVARFQARLENQFANLEVQLAGLQSQSDFLTNQLAQLSGLGQQQSGN